MFVARFLFTLLLLCYLLPSAFTANTRMATPTATITFSRGKSKLSVDGTDYDASNTPDSSSKGKWPNGTYKFSHHTPHPDETDNGSYGPLGVYVFDVPGRTGMGIHAGRADQQGWKHPTMGCIRTTKAGVQAVADVVKKHGKSNVQITVHD